MVVLASLNSVVDRLEHGCAGQLEALNMIGLSSLNSVVDSLEHGWAGQLEQCC